MPTTRHATPDPAHTLSPRQVRAAMSGLIIAFLIANLDHMIVSTALPTIAGQLGDLEALAGVATAYTVATAVTTPVWGKLGDLRDRKAVFMAAFAIFLAGSALCGMAGTMPQLIAFRAVQGIGGGGLLVGGIAIVGALVPPRERAKHLGLLTTIMPLAILSGPLIGGVITDTIGWRWAFYLNLPLGAVALWLLATQLHLPPQDRARGRLDAVGATTIGVAIIALSLLTTRSGTQAWNSPGTLIPAAVLALAVAAFLLWEKRAEEPLIPLTLFRSRNFTLAALLSLASGMVMFGAVTFLPLYQQFAQGASPTASGLLLLPLLGGMLVTAPLVGSLVTKFGRFRIYPILGSAAMTAGAAVLSMLSPDTSQLLVGAAMLAVGFGMGCFMQLTSLIAQNSAPAAHLGSATGTSMLFRNVGNSLGVSLLGAVYVAQMRQSLTDRIGPGGIDAAGAGLDLSPRLLAQLPPGTRDSIQEAVSDGVGRAFLVATAIAALMVVTSCLLREEPAETDR